MKKRILGVLVVCFLMLLQASAFATELFPLEEVRPGLRGFGKTVIQGTNIEEFQVEVIGVVPQAPPTPPLIMVRVSGDVIDRSGGIAQGMSGSPIYIQNKLLGAIGYGYAMTDHRVGLVTPAVAMLAMMDEGQSGSTPVVTEGFQSLTTPLMVGGINGRALKFLQTELQPLNLEVMAGTTGVSGAEYGSLEPGSAFGVQLLRGDFQAAAFGTVTHVEGDQFVGFGHSFMHKGDVNFFVSPAEVHYTMPSIEFPFKVASAGPTIGTLTQDRAAGVGGVLGEIPGYLPVNVQVVDKDRQLKREYQVESVLDEALMPHLVVSSVYQGIDATLDRVGKGTAYVRVEFSGDNLPTRVIRENMYYSDSDIAVWTLVDLIDGLEMLVSNNFQEVDLTKVDVRVEVEKQRRTATIEKATPRQFQVQPGESVDVEVTIRPYRGRVESRVLRVTIPEDTIPGTLTVTVRNGGSGYYFGKPTVHTTWKTMELEDEESHRLAPTGSDDFGLLLTEFMDREQNNEIVAEFYPFFDSYGSTEDPEELSLPVIGETQQAAETMEVVTESDIYGYGWDETANDPIRVRLSTQYVIEGMATFDLEVLEP